MTPSLLHQLLEASAASHPDRVAIADGDRSLTYAELDAAANRLAHLLLDLGVERTARVGLYLDKSLEAVVGVYGTLKAGATYVPMDPRGPARRVGFIAGNCGIEVLLTGTEKAEAWQDLMDAGAPLRTVIVLNGSVHLHEPPAGARVVPASALDGQPDASPEVPAVDRDLAYILYTSGSTGEPKGVMLSHRNALTFVDWATDLLHVGPEDRLSSHAPFHFDLSVFDLFGAARGGASVVLVPPEASVLPVELARFIAERRITVWYSVPSVLTMLARHGGIRRGAFRELRAVVFAGEIFPVKYLRQLMAVLPHAEFHNWYGPTETNVCTAYRVPPLSPARIEPVSIGRAIANMEVFALTEDGRRARSGEEGELYVRGSGVMQGYWGNPEGTAQVLLPNPLGDGVGDLVYRTGDLVVEQEDGNLLFVGRRDAQIKSRGYRIELGEIENALLAHPDVVECAVTAVPDDLITNRIRAHVVILGEVGKAELVRFCAERIPHYMIPEEFEFRRALPKTSTGKIDRQALAGRET